MRVTLAYPIDGVGAPDETVDVDEAQARQLVADGFARWPEVDDLEALTVEELRRMAVELRLDVPRDARKADLVEAVKSSTNRRPTGANDQEDTDGR